MHQPRTVARRWRAVTALAALVASASCTSSATHAPARSTSPGTHSSARPSTSSVQPTPPGKPTSGDQLSALLQAGARSIRTAHLNLVVSIAGVEVTSAGDEQLTNGAVDALQLTQTLPSGDRFEFVVVGDKYYARLPASLYKTSKPWVLISADSPTPQLKQLAATIDTARSSASLDRIGQFVGAASSVRVLGATTVGGEAATRYAVLVDTARLPASFPGKAGLQAAGLKSVPLQIYVDGRGRPVRVAETVTAQDQTVATTATVTRYNQPVTITAPPAGQVGTK